MQKTAIGVDLGGTNLRFGLVRRGRKNNRTPAYRNHGGGRAGYCPGAADERDTDSRKKSSEPAG